MSIYGNAIDALRVFPVNIGIPGPPGAGGNGATITVDEKPPINGNIDINVDIDKDVWDLIKPGSTKINYFVRSK